MGYNYWSLEDRTKASPKQTNELKSAINRTSSPKVMLSWRHYSPISEEWRQGDVTLDQWDRPAWLTANQRMPRFNAASRMTSILTIGTNWRPKTPTRSLWQLKHIERLKKPFSTNRCYVILVYTPQKYSDYTPCPFLPTWVIFFWDHIPMHLCICHNLSSQINYCYLTRDYFIGRVLNERYSVSPS